MSWTVDPMHTQVEFSAKHMGIMTVKGQITGVQAMIEFNEDMISLRPPSRPRLTPAPLARSTSSETAT